jgi:hypothetical protein
VTSPPGYFVTLTARCDLDDLHVVVDHLSQIVPGLVDALPTIEGMSLSYYRDDTDTDSTSVPLPEPVTGVVTPPPPVAEQTLPTAPVPTATDGSPA